MLWELLTAPVSGLLWIAETIEAKATAELDRQENLQRKLTALQLQFDLGEISEAEFMEQEQALLTAIAEQEDNARP
ncbi:MAG: gas vesicle protein GvpG [Pseudanabaenaceae cyanobacterium]